MIRIKFHEKQQLHYSFNREDWCWEAGDHIIKLIQTQDMTNMKSSWSMLCVFDDNLVYFHNNKVSLKREWSAMAQALVFYSVFCEPLTPLTVDQYQLPDLHLDM